MPRRQRTVRREAQVEGVGLHTGARASLRIAPAGPDHGVVFVRSDLENAPRVRAHWSRIRERERRTALVGEHDAEVHTVEHFLAALQGLGVDNLEVTLSGPECPGIDGSALAYLDLVDRAEIVEQDAPRAEVRVRRPLVVDTGRGASLTAFPASGEGLTIAYSLHYDLAALGSQHVSVDMTPETFRQQIAPARTFCLAEEAEALRAAGLGKGADHSNTLVFGPDGLVEGTLRFPDEPARHKALDLLGDLYLLGADIVGHVAAYRTGHAANLALVKVLADHEDEARGAAPGPRGPALGPAQVRRILPHRYPFLLVDRVIELDGFTRAVGIKNVSVNEPFFVGHYPEEPIMPGVLILEAMAQLAGILLLRKLELSGKIPVLLSIDRVKFRRAVVPGDQIRMEAFTLRLSAGRGRIRARSTVDGELVSEARLNFALTEAPRS